MSLDDIYSVLDRLPPIRWTGTVFRQVNRNYLSQALSGLGAQRIGGRWNPPHSFRTIYLSLAVETVLAEFKASLGPGRDALAMAKHHVLVHVGVDVASIADLRDAAILRRLGLSVPLDPSLDRAVTQEIGAAVYYLRLNGLVAPSFVHSTGLNLVLFPDTFTQTDRCEVDKRISVVSLASLLREGDKPPAPAIG